MTDKLRVFDVFYRDYQHDVSISSAAPEPLDAKRLAPLAQVLLKSPDNFFGVVDSKHSILQFYLDDEAAGPAPVVVVELLFAEKPGYHQADMSLADALALLDNLSDPFDVGLLPGGRRID